MFAVVAAAVDVAAEQVQLEAELVVVAVAFVVVVGAANRGLGRLW